MSDNQGAADEHRDVDADRLWDEAADDFDLGCGTGTMSVLLHGLGHEVHGVDLSRRMIERARRKAPGRGRGPRPTYVRADAARPPVRPASVDVVLWGKDIDDERYLLVAERRPSGPS